jgi:hypothetical protein
MPFQKGQITNPGGRKKALGLSHAVRASEGLKLLAIRDDMVSERKQVGTTNEGAPIMVDAVPSIKDMRETVKLILAYIGEHRWRKARTN